MSLSCIKNTVFSLLILILSSSNAQSYEAGCIEYESVGFKIHNDGTLQATGNGDDYVRTNVVTDVSSYFHKQDFKTRLIDEAITKKLLKFSPNNQFKQYCIAFQESGRTIKAVEALVTEIKVNRQKYDQEIKKLSKNIALLQAQQADVLLTNLNSLSKRVVDQGGSPAYDALRKELDELKKLIEGLRNTVNVED